MPKPGSHKYDTERAHLRKRLEQEGINDKEADRRANEILQQDPQKEPEAPDDRAAGPKGDRATGPRGKR